MSPLVNNYIIFCPITATCCACLQRFILATSYCYLFAEVLSVIDKKAMSWKEDKIQGKFCDGFMWGTATASYQIEGLFVS